MYYPSSLVDLDGKGVINNGTQHGHGVAVATQVRCTRVCLSLTHTYTPLIHQLMAPLSNFKLKGQFTGDYLDTCQHWWIESPHITGARFLLHSLVCRPLTSLMGLSPRLMMFRSTGFVFIDVVALCVLNKAPLVKTKAYAKSLHFMMILSGTCTPKTCHLDAR